MPGIPKYSAEDTSLVVGNGAGETAAFRIPAGSEITLDVIGLHHNRESCYAQLPMQNLQQVAQQGTGMIHSISNQRGFWVNGTGMPSSCFLGVQELALVTGKLLTFKFKG